MKIRTRLSLGFLVVSLVPLTLASLHFYLLVRGALDDQVEAGLRTEAAARRVRVSVHLNRSRERFALVAGQSPLRRSVGRLLAGEASERDPIEATLTEALGALPTGRRAEIVDRTGRVVASTDPQRRGVLDRAPGGSYEHLLVVDGTALTSRLAGPLDPQGDGAAGLVLDLDARPFLGSIATARGRTYLVAPAGDGRRTLYPPADGRVGELVLATAEGRSGVHSEIDEDGATLLVALEPVAPGWGLVVATVQSEAYSAIARVRQLLVLTAVLACLLTSLLSLRMGRAITRPLDDLTRAAHRMGEGDLSGIHWTTSIEELDILRETLDDMACRLQESLDEARHLAAIVENTTDAINATDLDDRVTSWNEAAEQLYGLGADRMIGASISRIVPADRADEPRLIRDRIGRGERIDGLETVRLDHAGRPLDVSLTVSPIRDRSGAIVGASTIARDIGERKRAERQLAFAETRIEHILDSLPSIVVAVDPHRSVTHWNRKAAAWTGTDNETAIGRPVEEVLPLVAGHVDRIESAIAGGKARAADRIRVAKRDLDLRVYPLLADTVLGAVVRIDDVTERVALEERILQSEKMMSVGGLAAGMAHEINNPLGAMLQGTQNIIRRVSPDLPRNRRVAMELDVDLDKVVAYLEARQVLRFLDGVRDAGSRAAKIVADMLAFSRQSRSRAIACDVHELLDATLRLAATDWDLKRRYDFKHIEIERDYDLGVGPVRCDPQKIEQVFLNLVKNAAQALAAAGTVEPRIVLSTRTEDDMVRIEIADNGPGMDAETRRRVFEPFFTTKEVGEGTGLGLSVSYFIVREHGGTMTVRAEPDEGTRFVLHLPRIEPPSETP